MKNWLIGNMGTPGEYQYQSIHLLSALAVLAAVAAVIWLGRSKQLDSSAKGRLLRGICWFQLGFELAWRIVYVTVKGDSIACWWPLYPCNLGGILVPIFALMGCKRGKDMFYLFGLLGGIITFAMPEGIFTSDVLSFPILKSILQHTGLLLIPSLEMAWGTWRPSIKTLGWAVLGCLVHLVNCEGITRLLGFTGDYMYFRSGLPFVIPGVAQFITLGMLGCVLLTLCSLLGDFAARKR